MPETATPRPPTTELTYLDKRMFCDLRNGLTLHLGLVGASSLGARNPPEFIQFQTDDAVVSASLLRVTSRAVRYREVTTCQPT